MGEETYENTRKRPRDEANEAYHNKRSNNSGKPLLKILVPNYVAGKLIGKGGTNINELQTTFSASIQVSHNKECYPGTEDRIVTICGGIDDIIQFTTYMIEKVMDESDSDKKHMNPSSSNDLKMVVTNIAAGLVIGKAGATIKGIQDECKARINISKRDEGVSGERILVVSGSVQQRISACSEIIAKMSEEPSKMSTNTIKYDSLSNDNHNIIGNIPQNNLLYNSLPPNNNPSFIFNGMPNGLAQTMGSLTHTFESSNYQSRSKVKTRFQVEMEIPDEMVGAILGKQGSTIGEFSRASGAKLKFSAKNEFVSGTTDRILTITGGMNEIQSAYKLVDQKVAQLEHEFNGKFRRS